MMIEDKLNELSQDDSPDKEVKQDDRVLKALELMDDFEQDIKDEVSFEEAVAKLKEALDKLKEGSPEEESMETPEEEDEEKKEDEGDEGDKEEDVPLNVPPLNQVF